MNVETFNRISEVNEDVWQHCVSSGYPFLQYGFLRALEESGSVSAESGWQPKHLVVKEGGHVLAVMPQYFKTHSWGEYVFDQEWANAYHRYGVRYYPKLINAIPFTPATGPRWALRKPENADALDAMLQSSLDMVTQNQVSSWHCLFPSDKHEKILDRLDVVKRYACQFHWFNQDYLSFEDFLSRFASRKRKNVRKERKAVKDLGLCFKRESGTEMSDADWTQFYEFYAGTYYKRNHSPHLSLTFFKMLAGAMGSSLFVDWVYESGDSKPIAAALFFKDSNTLYGRYWGCRKEVHGLHFEVCFYRGIEYAIEQKLQRFDPGAQGEHKISRGFEPVMTTSFHAIGHPGFKDAIQNFVVEEKRYIDEYRDAAAQRLPFKSD